MNLKVFAQLIEIFARSILVVVTMYVLSNAGLVEWSLNLIAVMLLLWVASSWIEFFKIYKGMLECLKRVK